MSEEWGPWIEHDGRKCPVVGKYCRVMMASGEVIEKVCGTWDGPEHGIPVDCWDWSDWNLQFYAWNSRVIRYRIRKPRGLTVLQNIASTPSQPVREDA